MTSINKSGRADKASLKIYWRLLAYLKPHLPLFLLSMLGFIIFAATQPMLGYTLKFFVDGLSDPDAVLFPDFALLSEMRMLKAVPLLIISISTLQGIGFFLGNYFLARVGLGLVHDLRVQLFNNLLTLPNSYFDGNNSGHLISRITYNVTMVTGAATSAIKTLVREGMTVVFLLGMLLWMNWKLTLVILAVLPVIAVLVTLASKKFRKHGNRIQQAMGDVTHVSSEAIQGYRVVRSFGGREFEQERFHKVSADNTYRQLRMERTSAIYTPVLQWVVYVAMSLLLFLTLLLRGDATAGELVAYITLASLMPKSIRQLSELSPTIQRGVAGAESIFAQLDEQPEADTGTVELQQVQGRLEVRNLGFCYPGTDKQVLQDISFVAEPGQMVALVGRSGSGKTTLANLVPRFYDYSHGQILLDGVELRDIRLDSLRRHISVVNQQVSLFNDTVANNIAYGELRNAGMEQIRAAASDAYADEFISKMPEGYQTVVGEDGVLLSGGQRQRLAIARALLKDAPLLILDEATSALDTESERHIQAALERAVEGRTTLVIAHRLSTIEQADLILVMDKGSIVESGSHAELLKLNGYYSKLHATQFDEEEEQDAVH